MDLVVVFGPPAVGKMAVGRELCRLTGYRLFHNHLTIEPLLELFDYGSPPFVRLLTEFRWRILAEAAASTMPGLVATFVWDLADTGDCDLAQGYVDLVEAAGGAVGFVELSAPLAVRQARNNTELRLAEKRSKRDRAFNDANLLAMEAHRMSTGDGGPATPADALLARYPHLRLDNSDLAPAEAARQVAVWWSAQRQRQPG